MNPNPGTLLFASLFIGGGWLAVTAFSGSAAPTNAPAAAAEPASPILARAPRVGDVYLVIGKQPMMISAGKSLEKSAIATIEYVRASTKFDKALSLAINMMDGSITSMAPGERWQVIGKRELPAQVVFGQRGKTAMVFDVRNLSDRKIPDGILVAANFTSDDFRLISTRSTAPKTRPARPKPPIVAPDLILPTYPPPEVR